MTTKATYRVECDHVDEAGDPCIAEFKGRRRREPEAPSEPSR